MNILMAGVGGQGIILASDILSEVMLEAGFDVKKSEIHGMAQRGGSVMSHVRFGEKVSSPTIALGTCDILLSFEELEAARYLEYLNPNTKVVINRQRILPPSVVQGQAAYPEVEPIIRQYTQNVSFVEGSALAVELNNAKGLNIVLLGALSALLDVNEELWLNALNLNLKEKIRAVNLEGFKRGRALLAA